MSIYYTCLSAGLYFLKRFESLFLNGNRGDRLLLMLCPLTSSLVCENKRALTYSSGHVTKEKKKKWANSK